MVTTPPSNANDPTEVWVKINVSTLQYGTPTIWDGGVTVWDTGATIWDTKTVPLNTWTGLAQN